MALSVLLLSVSLGSTSKFRIYRRRWTISSQAEPSYFPTHVEYVCDAIVFSFVTAFLKFIYDMYIFKNKPYKNIERCSIAFVMTAQQKQKICNSQTST